MQIEYFNDDCCFCTNYFFYHSSWLHFLSLSPSVGMSRSTAPAGEAVRKPENPNFKSPQLKEGNMLGLKIYKNMSERWWRGRLDQSQRSIILLRPVFS